MSQKLVMDKAYYNQFYRFKDNNAKLLKIRQQKRQNSTAIGQDSIFNHQMPSGSNIVGFPTSSTKAPLNQKSSGSQFRQHYNTLSANSSAGSQINHML